MGIILLKGGVIMDKKRIGLFLVLMGLALILFSILNK